MNRLSYLDLQSVTAEHQTVAILSLATTYIKEREKEVVVHLLQGKRFNSEDTHWSKVQYCSVSIFDDKQMVSNT